MDRHVGNSLDGGICAVDTSLGGNKLRLASVYVPVVPAERKIFLEKLEAEKVLTPKTISQGDWNCVADVALDIRYVDASKDPSASINTHGNSCEALLTKSGLTDVFRLIHGNQAEPPG